MDQAQAQMFINSNCYPKLWGYDAEKEKWTFSIRPWMTFRLDTGSVKPVGATRFAGLAELRDATGNPARPQEAEVSLFERETPVITKRLLWLPGVVFLPLPLEETGEISQEDYRFARCLERPDASGELPLNGILQRLGWTVAGQ